MRKATFGKIWVPVLILAVVMAGCGDPDANPGSPGSPLTTPTVTTVSPLDGSSVVCPNVAVISATFSKAMNPATINASTFTVSGPSGKVSGIVTYNSATNIALFTPPAASLIASTKYTATITTEAADTFGNHLAANFTWSFTTSVACLLPPSSGSGPAGMGAACTFGILAGSTVANVIPTTPPGPTHVTGDVGVWAGTAITGFPPGTITGAFFTGPGPGAAMTAQGDLTVAYNNAMNAGGGPAVGIALTADIGGQTLPPGVYIAPSSLGITGILTLDGSTNPNGVWIFKVPSALTTADGSLPLPASQVLLIGGAQAHNVFWQVTSSATLGTFSLFRGTIMALASVTLKTGATLDGRALARNGAVNTDNNPINVPSCP